jgi:hypothetical protein
VQARRSISSSHRAGPLLPRQESPGPQPRAFNDLHEIDLLGPIYLQGCSHRDYIGVGKDAFDSTVCLRLAESRRMEEVLWVLGECWKDLGIPAQVRFDNPGSWPAGGRRHVP